MTRVLVPVAILEGMTVSSGLMNLLGTMNVTVLGYHVLPEQTPTDQARLQYEDRATSALNDLSEEFQMAGGSADHRLVFTHDLEKTIERVADETDSRAFALTGATGDVDRILVSLSGDVATDRILTFVDELIGGRDIEVTLFLATTDESEANERLKRAANQLAESGISIDTEATVSTSPFRALVDAVPGHDAVVIGEKAPSRRSSTDEAKRVAGTTVSPVLVVRHDTELDEEDGHGADVVDRQF